jgi:hypothetical protein
MAELLAHARIDSPRAQSRNRRSMAGPLLLPGTTAAFALTMAGVVLCFQSRAAGRVQEHPAAPPGKPAAPDFAAKIRWTLKQQQDRMVQLANQVLRQSDGRDKLRDQFIDEQILRESAKANFSNAKLSREVAEIAMAEYKEGIFVQDKATAEGAVALAQSDLNRARDSIVIAKDQLARIKRASQGSSSDIAIERTFADLLDIAERSLPKSELALAQAESKLKNLVEFTGPKTIKELQSEVKKARSDELEKQAAWQLAESKLKRLDRARQTRDLAARDRQAQQSLRDHARDSLDRAIAIEAQLRSQLDQFAKDGKGDDRLRNKIRDLSQQLEDLIDQAEADQSAARFDQVKERIRRAAH